MNALKTAIANLCRTVLGLTFIFSGFVKAVDPLGTQYKIHDYAEALGLLQFAPDALTLALSVALSATEFIIGMLLLFGIMRKATSRVALLFMMAMTAVTLGIWIAEPVQDCGCFGDAVHLSNSATLLKNIGLTACAIAVALMPRRGARLVSESTSWIVVNYTIIFVLLIAAWSLYALPYFDFRPYHIGADIRAGMSVPDNAEMPEFETTLIMRRGDETREFSIDDYPDDTTWQFIDSRTTMIKAGYVPPVHDFSVVRMDTGTDITDSLLADTVPTLLLVSPYIEQADDANFGEIDRIYEHATATGLRFVCLTASGEAQVRRWQDLTGAEYPFCNTDGTTLKTMIRSNPGLMLLRKGVVAGKWSHNLLPSDQELDTAVAQCRSNRVADTSLPRKTVRLLLWFVLPLTLLTIADRLWAWGKWVRNKRDRLLHKKEKTAHGKGQETTKQDKPNHKQNQKTMRKKIVAGNWKMNMNLQDGVALAKELNTQLTAERPNCDVVICTPFIHLASVAQFLDQDIIGLGAENCADKEKGAYTGEVSAEMVKSTGARYVILGHSERRGYYHETPEILKEKVLLALKNGLKVIFCIGESLEEREANRQNEVCKAELEGSVFNLTAEEFANVVIAYEPIWAIGTGKTATSDQAEEIHAYIRSLVASRYGAEVADNTSILYGGSCKASNAPELFAKPDIDGGLIGGASLKAADFRGIIDAWK